MLKAKTRICFLDSKTVDLGDLDLKCLRARGNLRLLDLEAGDRLPKAVQEAEILISNKFPLGEHEFKQLPKLKLIAVAATGINNVALNSAKKRGIAVCNVPGYSTSTVVEHTLLFLLAFAHRLVEHDAAVKAGAWTRSPHFALLDFPFSDLAGKSLGILGYGAIGRRVARVAKALGMKVLVGRMPGRKYSLGEKRIGLKALLSRSDFVSLHCPLTEQTEALLDREKLSWMKSSGVLLNLARGPIVVEAAVAKALRAGRLAGYGADVSTEEPPPSHHPLLAKSLAAKVIMTPHIAWASRESRQRLIEEISRNVLAFQRGARRHRVL